MAKKLKVVSAPIESLSEPWCDPQAGTAHDLADIEALIKGSFAQKAGCFHYDTTNNRYLVFSDEEARDAYLENPEDNMDLLLAFFDAPFNYSAVIELLSDRFVPILAGTAGNVIEFTFDTLNKSGQSVGEDVLCTFTFVRGSVRKTVTQKYRAGAHVRFNVDEYLDTGTNNVTIGIVGQTTLAATTVGVTFQVVDLSLTDSFDLSKHHDLSATTQIEVPFTVSGYGAKTMEWIVDGEQLPFVRSEDEITEAATSRTKYIPIDGFSQGAHSLQFRTSTVINGEKFYSKTLYREFIVYSRDGQDPIVAVGADFPLGASIIGPDDPLALQGLAQYIPYTLKLGLFNPTYATNTPLEVYLDGELLTTLSMQNARQVTYDLAVTSYGDKVLKLKSGLVERRIPVAITKSSTSIEEIAQGLSLALSAAGKSNAASDRNVWKSNGYSTLFNGFKWLSNSGWNNGELVISGGASISINCAPLAADVLVAGKTLEFEFSARNVTDIDAVICDLRNAGGTGLLITASEASITSAGGSRVSTRYKSGENVRLSFVINKKSGSADKGLVMLYVNGILSGAANYAANDNFISAKTISFASSADADIALRSIRFYDTPLTANQILNNYILYRPTAEELLKAYDRNNIYEEGSSDFSTDILSGQLPVMIVTGDIPTLEATTDKNLQIDVDVEYINLQDQSRSFKLKNGAMRPQGTSSMSYPKKNFRLYTNKKDSTVLYNADGGVVADRKYAFKEGAQPVDCWCLKADYAESSGTHNTGIARLWNDAMKNAQVSGEYKCRTAAQQAAVDNGYPYDVRTTIDGFPILMFYRLTDNDPLVFIGKYNFNNDKSTESVFGFRDIPGFDSSKVECWEVLNNGHHLALFQDTDNWEREWSDAFEARYPDGSKDTSALKVFATWLVFLKGRSDGVARFSEEKYQHLDVYKMAAYYVYLMRFGAVDQVVKNAMFTTEDGVHWYYINYDNDTVNGLRNDGLLIYPPTIDRQTPDPTIDGVYAYAGHDSLLWNMLEADADFMRIVSEVDSALYSAGLSYVNVIRMFDTEQSDKWCERIYNQDAQYKYIGPFSDRGVNNLFMLQGSRQSHRRWWLSERFSLLDAKFVSGEYKANSFEVKLAGAPIGLEFSIKAGVKTNYGYGVNNVPIQYGMGLNKGENHTFTTTSVLNVGDPLRLYAAPYLEEIDIAAFAPYLTQISIANVYSDRLGTKLKTLKLGTTGTENAALAELSGINQASGLKYLDVTGFKGVKTLDLAANTMLETLVATDSGLTSVLLPSGAPITSLSLPASLQALSLHDLYQLESSGLTIQNNGCNLTTIEISNCCELDTQTLIEDWLDYKTVEDSACSLIINGVEWNEVDVEWLLRLGNLRSLSLKGVISVSSITEEQLTQLQQLFGKNCFSATSELYIQIPADASLYFIGPDSVRALSSTQYEMVVATPVPGKFSFSVEGTLPSGVTFVDGFLSVGDISSDTTITLVGKFIPEEGLASVKRKTVLLIAIKYPKNNTIEGSASITKKGVFYYPLTLSEHDEDANFYVEWEISGAAVTSNLVSLGTTSKEGANVIVNQRDESTFKLTAKVYRSSNNSLVSTATKTLTIFVGDVIMTAVDNPNMMRLCYQKGLAASSKYMTAAEASAVTDASDLLSSASLSDTFNEFVHFVNVSAPTKHINIGELTVPFEKITSLDHYMNVTKLHCPYLKNLEEKYGTINLNLTEFDAPVLESIKSTYSQSSNSVLNFTREIQNLSFPSLKTIHNMTFGLNNTNVSIPAIEELSNGGFNMFGIFSNKSIKSLEGIENAVVIEGFNIIPTNSTELLAENLTFRNLESLSVPYKAWSNSNYTNIFGSNLKTFSAPKLQQIIGDNFHKATELTEVNLPMLKYVSQDNASFNAVKGLFNGCSLIDSINLPSLEEIKHADNFFKNCSSLISVLLPSLKTVNYYYSDTTMFTGCVSLENIVIGDCLSLKLHSDLVKLRNLSVYKKAAPSLTFIGNVSLIGSEVEEGTPKVIHVLEDATGYDVGNWASLLNNADFTLVKDLPAPENEE